MDVNRDDPESADAASTEPASTQGNATGAPSDGGLDLTPRERKTGGAKKGWAAYAVIALVVIGAGAVLVNGLSNATQFFYNVDEAIAKKDELADRRLRVQGHPVADSIEERSNGVDFVLRFNGASLQIHHSGPVPDLFDPEIPVVVEGRFVDDEFESDNILVKHDETYEEDNGDRITEAEKDAETDSSTGAG